MVRPVTSKRKLFNNGKDQFKENKPDQINSSESDSFPSKTHGISPSLYSTHKLLNGNKIGIAEGSSCEGRREREGLGSVDWQRRCDIEDGGNGFTPGRTVMPMSERQQIALLMQLSSPSPTNKSDLSSLGSPQTPTTPHYSRSLIKRNERGETPLHVAAIKGDREKVSQLISQGANVNVTDYAGWTALHEACNRGFMVIASLLIKGGADVNAKGLDNDTPLHDACVNNHFQIVRLLLRSGAKTDEINCRGKSPLDICRSTRILSLLEQAKAGKLEEFDSPEKDFSRVKVQDLERDIVSINHSPQNYLNHLHNKAFGMSRKTPPNNKGEDKPSIPISNSSLVPTSTSGGATASGNGASSGGNGGRPVSPRITLRLPHVPRTPDKSQQRAHETKSAAENEDVYEFRCSKEESKESESDEKSEPGTKQQDATPSEAKGDKRPRENEIEEEEKMKKKKRKEELKEGAKNVGRGVGGRPSILDKGLKSSQRTIPGNGSSGKQSGTTLTTTNITPTTTISGSTSVASTNSSNTVSSSSSSNNNNNNNNNNSNNTTEQRKSPSGSAVSSPKPTPSVGSKNTADKSDSDSEEVKNETTSGAPKVPPLKIVLAPCSLSEQETSSLNGKNGSNRQLPYVVNSSSGNAEEKENAPADFKDVIIKEECVPTLSGISGSGVSSSSIGSSSGTTIVVSSMANVTSTSLNSNNGNNGVISTTSVSGDKERAARITRSQRGAGGSNSGEDQAPVVKIEPKSEDQMPTDVIHPRKRKLKMKEPEVEQPPPTSVPEQPITNCYEMFLKIRKQVERRRKLLFPVQPKPPQGFKDYLMNRCSYVLANNSNSQLSVPVIPAPSSLAQALKDLFNEQEQERYKLRLQQLIEKEKLVLSVEQEILRVHGRAARALANQVLPFSVCTILKDEEVYNVISPEQEEKDRNARSRYNGRLFLSWLQDVDDKWEKIKEAMVLRHHNEAESLHAVQKMDWEWKMKDLGLVEQNTKTQIDELHVPMVQVADFDLLPA